MRLIHIARLRAEKGIPYHPQHIRRLIRANKFPRPIPCGRLTTFDEEEVDSYLEGLKAERDLKLEGGA
jgi:hypothetical protein